MGCNNSKYSDTCGVQVYATCVTVEQTFPSISSLSGESCADLDAVVTDLYELAIASQVDMTAYDKGCLDYSPTLDADITPVDVLNKLTSVLCTVQSDLAALDAVDISVLDWSCLGPTDTCGDPISVTTTAELIQLLIDEICALKTA